jgi:hypothetical protein
MKRTRAVTAGIALAALLMIAPSAWAAPLTTENVRPVPVTGTALQGLLNTVAGPGVLNVHADQHAAGYWSSSSPVMVLNSLLLNKEGQWAGYNNFGIWADSNGDTDGLGRAAIDIFNGNAAAGVTATLDWATNPGSLTITGGPGVNTGIFNGVEPFGFGFYVSSFNGTSSTIDQLNYNGGPQALAFRLPGPGGNWILAFEDLPLGLGGDGDYTPYVVSVNSIEPVPEPATLLLLGSGLVGLGGARWRRKANRV